MNGALDYSKTLPAYPWLSRYPTRQWYAAGEPSLLPDWQHPRLLRQYPDPEHNPFRTLLLEQERVFDCLTRLPAAFYHGDFYPTNLISRTAPDGEAETVVLDWGMAGISCLGEDLGQLCMGACVNLKNVTQAEIIDALFDSYMNGLRDADCRADPALVRLGFSAMAAFRIGAVSLWMIDEELKQGWKEDAEQAVPAPEADCFEVALARSTLALLEGLSLL
jgi:hypothetical protein